MPTTSDTSNGIDAALSLGATSRDALDQRLEPRRLTVWLGLAFVLHVAGFAAFVVWQPTWFEPRAAVPDVPVDVTWLGVVREPEVTPPAPPPRPLSKPQAPPPKAVQPPKVAPKISQAATPVATKAKVSEPTPEPAAALVKPSLVAPAVVPSAVLADPPPPLETLTAPLETSLTAVSPPSSTSPLVASTPVASTPAAPPSQAPVPAVRSEPTLIASSRQSPVYPRASRRAGEAGTVVLRINIAASGAVTATAVVVSSGFERLDAAAQKAVQQWRFTPGMVDGVPTAMPLQVPIRFELQ